MPLESLTGRERMLRAARRMPVDRPPIWMMRQAGRYLPEYHEIRNQGSFMETVRDPSRAAEITLQPMRRFAMDAAVVFCDILVPPAEMGLNVSFETGKGPIIDPPVRTKEAVEALSAFDPEESTGFLMETLRRVREALGDRKALIGFCGAPWTTASYMIEGGSSRNFEHTKKMMYEDPDLFSELLERIVDALIPYLGVQVQAGADLLQVFDSWGGALDAATYQRVVGPAQRRLITVAKGLGVPVILYVNGCSHLLSTLADMAPDVLGIDWRVDPSHARKEVGDRCALQGNLDPVALLAPSEVVRGLVRANMEAFGSEPGHIFNLGSGLIPSIPPESVAAAVEEVVGPGGETL